MDNFFPDDRIRNFNALFEYNQDGILAGDSDCSTKLFHQSSLGTTENFDGKIRNHAGQPIDLNITYMPIILNNEIGLAVSYKIIEAHQGILHIKSQMNQGTIFELHLPIVGQR